MILPLKLVKFQNVFSTQSRPPGNQTKSLSLKFSLQLFTWLVSWVGFLGDGTKLKIYSEIFLPLHMQRKEIGCNEKGSRPIQFLLIDVLSHEHWPVCCKCSTKSYNYLINTPNKITFQIAFRIQIRLIQIHIEMWNVISYILHAWLVFLLNQRSFCQ